MPFNQVILCSLLLAAMASVDAEDRILVGYEPGCWAKVYVPKKWPIDALPSSPAGTLTLEEMPQIQMTAFDRDNNNHPNILIEHPLLKMQEEHRHYAIEFEGYIQVATDGEYTISAVTDDRCEVYVEGKRLFEIYSDLKSDHRIYNGKSENDKPSRWTYGRGQGTAKLTAGRWYHVSIISKQLYKSRFDYDRYFNGAHLQVFLGNNNLPPKPIQLHLPIYDD